MASGNPGPIAGTPGLGSVQMFGTIGTTGTRADSRGDDRAEQQVVGRDDIGLNELDRIGRVGGERLGGPGDEAVAYPTEHRERVRRLPVVEQILVGVGSTCDGVPAPTA